MGPRSCRLSPVRRRTRRASSRLARRACAGQARNVVGRRRPRTRSARPDSTGAARYGSSPGSSEPSQSQKQTTSAVAASSPAWQAAPKPRTGSLTTYAPSSAATCAEPSVEPLSTTIARHPRGIRASTHGRAAASSRQGRTTSATTTGGLSGPTASATVPNAVPGSVAVGDGLVTLFTLRRRVGHIGRSILTKHVRQARTGPGPWSLSVAGVRLGSMSSATVPVPAPPVQQSRRRVLVVDDDLTVAEVVASYLDRAGFDVDRVADGPAAVAR